MEATTYRPENEARSIEAFGLKNPMRAIMTRDLKTKLGLAFAKGERVTVYEGGIIETGPYAGQQSYSAYSRRNDCLTAIRPSSFKRGF